jgi:hypothetical protein
MRGRLLADRGPPTALSPAIESIADTTSGTGRRPGAGSTATRRAPPRAEATYPSVIDRTPR